MHTINEQRKALEAFAWPGGYPILYMAMEGWREDDGTLTVNHRAEYVCCAKCAIDTEQWPDLIVTGSYIHYEGSAEQCEFCDSLTQSAYGDPDQNDDADNDEDAEHDPIGCEGGFAENH